MKVLKNKSLLSVLALCWVVSACNSSDDDGDMNNEMDAPAFAFSSDAADTYTRVDRMGMPAIATALIQSKDQYNMDNPSDDADSKYVTEIIGSLTFLHNALDEQLRGLNFTPCAVVGDGSGSCVAAAGPLILPDTLKINTATPAGFPNGRMLADPVIDVTLAVALLELTGDEPPHTALDLVGVLNPTANDKEFGASFPFLATPHE